MYIGTIIRIALTLELVLICAYLSKLMLENKTLFLDFYKKLYEKMGCTIDRGAEQRIKLVFVYLLPFSLIFVSTLLLYLLFIKFKLSYQYSIPNNVSINLVSSLFFLLLGLVGVIKNKEIVLFFIDSFKQKYNIDIVKSHTKYLVWHMDILIILVGLYGLVQ